LKNQFECSLGVVQIKSFSKIVSLRLSEQLAQLRRTSEGLPKLEQIENAEPAWLSQVPPHRLSRFLNHFAEMIFESFCGDPVIESVARRRCLEFLHFSQKPTGRALDPGLCVNQ
jgi:hypothetical protein